MRSETLQNKWWHLSWLHVSDLNWGFTLSCQLTDKNQKDCVKHQAQTCPFLQIWVIYLRISLIWLLLGIALSTRVSGFNNINLLVLISDCVPEKPDFCSCFNKFHQGFFSSSQMFCVKDGLYFVSCTPLVMNVFTSQSCRQAPPKNWAFTCSFPLCAKFKRLCLNC